MVALRKLPSVSPQRQALADAIAARDTERARLAAVSSAVEQARETRRTLEQRCDDLRARLTELKSSAVEDAIRAASEGYTAEAPSLRDAMLDLADAEAALEVAKATRERLQEQAEKGIAYSVEDRVRSAALAVLRAEAAEHARVLAAAVVKLHHEAFLRGREINWLIAQRVLPVVEEPGGIFGRAKDDQLRSAMIVLGKITFSADGKIKSTDPDGAAPWRAALAALENDATASLPIEGV